MSRLTLLDVVKKRILYEQPDWAGMSMAEFHEFMADDSVDNDLRKEAYDERYGNEPGR